MVNADSGFYVGADVGSTKVKVDTSWSYSNTDFPALNDSSNESVTDTATAATLKLGYYFDKNNRASVAIQRADFFLAPKLQLGSVY
jgi:hypothetical protein